MNAPAVRVKTCSQALKRRSGALDIGSRNVLNQIITPRVTTHSAAFIQRSNLNIGFTVIVFGLLALAMSCPFFPVLLARTTRIQVDDRESKRVSKGAPSDGKHDLEKAPG